MDNVVLKRRTFLLGTAASLALGAGLAARPARAYEIVVIGKDRWLFPGWEPVDDAGDADIQKNLALVNQARVMFAQKGIGLLLVSVPFKARYYPNELPSGVKIAPNVVSRYARVLNWMQQLGIKTLDLDAAISPIGSVAGQTVYYHTDLHWTAWSAEAAAAAIAPAIEAHWPLPSPTPDQGTPLTPWHTETRLGDLTVLLPKEQQSRIGDETYVLRQEIPGYIRQDQSGNDLLPPANIDVHVVGNSYSQPFFGLPQKLSNVLGRQVGLTWLRADTGPWQIMLNYVESAGFKTPPKVIVWQMNEAHMMFGPTAKNFWFDTSQMAPGVWLAGMKAAIDG